MKSIVFAFLALISTLCLAQIPQGYYDNATGSGYTLKTQLKTIITNGHITRSYSALFDSYATTDKDKFYENDNSILDIYSENPSGTDPYSFNTNRKCGTYQDEGDCYNREHLIPQSLFGKKPPMKSDSHFVVPSDGYVNNRRSRYPFGYVSNADFISENGSKRGTGNNKGYTDTVFEPIDEFKGDVARAVLYFAVRYEDNWNDSGWLSHNLTENPMNGTSDQFYDDWFLETMLEWHNNDPVSQREIDRNNGVYNFQGNRNPFIDHPEYIAMIWGDNDNQAPTTPTNLNAFNPTLESLELSWNASTDNVAVTGYDIFMDNNYLRTVTETNSLIQGLTENTTYCFKIRAKDAFDNLSGFSTEVCKATKDNTTTGNSNDLFFSEYVEGSSYNKALEIANFTGETKNLGDYTLKLAKNGNGFSVTYNLPQTSITSGDVFVITHANIASSCKSEQDISNSDITSFNGNDVVGLFKNGTLIDIIGELGSSSNFAKDKTLIRKATNPNPTYTTNEWTVKSKNDCSNLGFYSLTLSNSPKLPRFKLIQSKLSNDSLEVYPKKDTTIYIYNISGRQVFKRNLKDNNTISLKNLKTGLYIVQLEFENKIFTKKFIKQ